MTVLLLLSLYI